MNNEEKIIGMLEQMTQRQDKTDMLLEQVMQELTGFKQETNERLDKLEQEVRVVRTTQENTVVPQIKLLAEGHAMLSEKIDRLSIVEAQEDDMSVVKAAIKYLSAEITEIKKAM